MVDERSQTLGQIAVPCSWLSCRKPVLQELGPGRRKEYCSETCRRGADRDYKRAKAHVDTFQEQLRRSRYEVAAYGRKAEQETLTPDQFRDIEAAARVALARAEAVVEFDQPGDRAIRELGSLVDALRPFFKASREFHDRSA